MALNNDNAPHDVVIIGAGISGMIAANRAAQLGLRVLVLEQGTARYSWDGEETLGLIERCTLRSRLEGLKA